MTVEQKKSICSQAKPSVVNADMYITAIEKSQVEKKHFTLHIAAGAGIKSAIVQIKKSGVNILRLLCWKCLLIISLMKG
jgi:hypothetical protein